MADLNFVASVREQSHWTQASERIETRHSLVVLGATAFPGGPFNSVLRLSVRANASDLLDRASARFAVRGHGFSVYVRQHTDGDLEHECRARGLICCGDWPVMWLAPEMVGGGTDHAVAFEEVRDADGVRRFADLAAECYVSSGLPRAVTLAGFVRAETLLKSDVRLVIIRCREQPAACGLVLFNGCTAGVYWVGTRPAMRGRGLGTACALRLVELARRRGVDGVVLQASGSVRSLYRRLGFEEISRIRCYCWPLAKPWAPAELRAPMARSSIER